MDFGIGHSEKIEDWAYRSVHEMTTIAKTVVEHANGRTPARSYFSGGSTGGQQALSEAQRYPADYDGIVAGDPGNNRINLIYGFLSAWLATHDLDATPILPSAKLSAMARAAVGACDKNDGLEDGLIADPRMCRFDPSVLACKGEETDACLTPRQIEAANKVYAGAKTKSGQQLYPGWAPGSEAGWGTYITNPKEPVRIGLFRGWVFQDASWNPRSFDWDKDVATVNAKYPFLNALATDFSAFKSRGGKLIMYTGLADRSCRRSTRSRTTRASRRRWAGPTQSGRSSDSFPRPGWRTAAAGRARIRSTHWLRSRRGSTRVSLPTRFPRHTRPAAMSIAHVHCARILPWPNTKVRAASTMQPTSAASSVDRHRRAFLNRLQSTHHRIRVTRLIRDSRGSALCPPTPSR
jgi:hypothetical protein